MARRLPARAGIAYCSVAVIGVHPTVVFQAVRRIAVLGPYSPVPPGQAVCPVTTRAEHRCGTSCRPWVLSTAFVRRVSA